MRYWSRIFLDLLDHKHPQEKNEVWIIMNKEINTLSQEQAKTLMESTWGLAQERDRQMLTFLLQTGLKISEFVRLNVGDVFTGRRVRRSAVIPGAKGKPSRKIPLTREAREAVAIILDFNRYQGVSLTPSTPLVISRQKNRKDGSYRITPRQVQRIVKTLREDASLGFKTTPQTLRHTFAREMLGHGGDMEVLQKLLGHRSIKTTRVLYGKSILG